MAEETSTGTVPEPWPGYAEMDPDARQATLDKKIADAREHGDQSYAFLLASAVASYERVRELEPDTTQDGAAANKARKLHDDAGGWIGS